MMGGLAFSFTSEEDETSYEACAQKSQENKTRNCARLQTASNILRGIKVVHVWHSVFFKVRAMRIFIRPACLESTKRGCADRQTPPR
jgi:hypothetical protein